MILNLKISAQNLCKTALRQDFYLSNLKSFLSQTDKQKRRKFNKTTPVKNVKFKVRQTFYLFS
jgi:hypothetical protein